MSITTLRYQNFKSLKTFRKYFVSHCVSKSLDYVEKGKGNTIHHSINNLPT